MTERYKRYTIIDGKSRWIIVDVGGYIINKFPNKNEWKDLQTEPFKKNCRNTHYTDEELLNFLKLFYEKNERVPEQKDFENNPGYPVYGTYRAHFGSWRNAITLAGLYIKKRKDRYTDDELLKYLEVFHEENGKFPTKTEFARRPGYPSVIIYQKRFGNWNRALKLVGMDADTIIEQGMLQNEYQKGRLWEILVRNTFRNKSIDLSGINCTSTFDGICPNGQIYEAKSAGLSMEKYWIFVTGNKDKDEDIEAIEWYYFGAFNKYYTELLYVWRIPGEIIEGNSFRVGLYGGKFTVKNLKGYEITDKFKKLLNGYKTNTEK